MPNRPVQIRIGSPSSMDSRDDGEVTLRVEDAMSGEVLVDLAMTPGRFWRLIQGATRTQMGFVSPNLDRVGKFSRHEELRVPREITDRRHKDAEAAVQAWLDGGNQPSHWERVRIYHHNYGWAAHGTWWEDATPEDVQKYIDERHLD